MRLTLQAATPLYRVLTLLVCTAGVGPLAPAWAETALEREQRLRAREEQVLERQRKATETARAEAERRQREHATFAALESAAADLARGLTSPQPVEVAAVNPDSVILAGGRDVGVASGESLRCFARGGAIYKGSEQIGFDEPLVGEATVGEVREKMAFLQTAGTGLKVGDICYRKRGDFGTLGLIAPLYQGRRTRLGEGLGERLYHALRSRGVTLVERERLNRIIEEQTLGTSGLLDEATAVQIGKLAGAESLLLGSIDDTGSDILINVRVVSTSQGTVQTTQQAHIPKSEASGAMLSAIAVPERAHPAPSQHKGQR